ncbi:cytochrome P450 [Gorgonomyces haynaldii]|nr:cytochrome P450 [Gorgonomyces haynaldii]
MSTVLTGLIVFAVTYVLLLHFGVIKGTRLGFPGPKQYPLVGSLYAIFDAIKDRKLGERLRDIALEYGKYCEVSIGMTPILIVSDPEAHQAMMVNGDFERTDMLHKALFNKNALFALPMGDVWHKHRKTLQPAFGPTHLRQVIGHVSTKCDVFTRQITHDKKQFVMSDLFRAITKDVIGLTAFSYDFKAVEQFLTSEFTDETDPITQVLHTMQKRAFTPEFMHEWLGYGPNTQPTKRNLESVELVLREMMAQKRVRVPEEYDVVDRLRSEKNGFTDDEIIGEAHIFIVGYNTSSSTLTFLFKNMGMYPDKFKKLLEEIQAKKDEPITIESLGEYQYLDYFMKETQRLNPVGSMLNRTNRKPTVLGGRTIPANTSVFYSFFAVQTSEEYWPEPLVFKPERWEGLVPVRGTFLPFGAGPTMCLGQKMALIEIKTAVICLLRKLHLELVPDQDLSINYSVTAFMSHGLKMFVSQR